VDFIQPDRDIRNTTVRVEKICKEDKHIPKNATPSNSGPLSDHC
jgi:hypothetical protein